MKHQPQTQAGWGDATPTQPLPGPLDSETRALMRLFLSPILERAKSWSDLSRQLSEKGYGLGFLKGHLVIQNRDGQPVCTGSGLGVPLAQISARIGRPCIKADRSGSSGTLV